MSRGVGYDELLPYTSADIIYVYHQDEHEEPIDEGKVLDDHDKAYNRGSASNMSANSLGSAAAMQVG